MRQPERTPMAYVLVRPIRSPGRPRPKPPERQALREAIIAAAAGLIVGWAAVTIGYTWGYVIYQAVTR